jgi:hypothetical protein
MEGGAKVNGVTLWYRLLGQGEPVMQIHGAAAGAPQLRSGNP